MLRQFIAVVSNRTIGSAGAPVDFDKFQIQSPKRTANSQPGWDGFFPYYAGYPEIFARTLLKSANLPKGAVVLDPWNGSGTTTFSAFQLGLASHGFDLNPAMIVIARARLFPPSEADSIEPIARELVKGVRGNIGALELDDPLLIWFTPPTAALVRAVETRIREHLVGKKTITPEKVKLENISGLAATFYVALFSICRQLVTKFKSSNPTWLRKPGYREKRVSASREGVVNPFLSSLSDMSSTLVECDQRSKGKISLAVADTTSLALPQKSIDFILTSPPYCTRIDYTAATRIELAILDKLINCETEDLSRQMIGSTRVPEKEIKTDENWGNTCSRFLKRLKSHPSKASQTYYLKTHLDYFQKMSASLSNLSSALKPNSAAVLVVQDSYYKDVHNDLPSIISEMASASGLVLRRREDFFLKRSMAGVNPRARVYRTSAEAVEAVLCFEKKSN